MPEPTLRLPHDEKVRRVVAEVRAFAAAGEPVRFVKRSVSHTVPNFLAPDDHLPPVDLGPLAEILSIDRERRVAVTEPGVTFETLVRATLPLGLMPVVVPELRGITVGGAVAGCSVESLSYRYGGFHDSCLEYEVITSTGEVITCSPERDPDVFHMMHGAYGTLGILAKLTFKLLPAKPFVRLSYVKERSLETFWAQLQGLSEPGDHGFVDAIVHGPEQHVLCLGSLCDEAPFVSSYEGEEIFYRSTAEKRVDYLPTEEYFFRYDRECHWMTRTVPPLEWRPVRRLLGGVFLGSTNLITWSNRLRPLLRLKGRPEVVLDVFIPSKRFLEFFHWYRSELDFWPLWIVPYRTPAPYPWLTDAHQARMGENLFMDCAIYGLPNGDPRRDLSEVIERKVLELGGIKTLISRNHYDRETFWSIYSQPRWTAIKQRTDPANVFGDLYERNHPERR